MSTKYSVKIEISKKEVELTEGGHPEQVELMSTVPLGCEYQCSEQSTTICRVEVSITYSDNGHDEIAFQTDDNNTDTETCGGSLRVIEKYGFGTTLKLPISIFPKDDGKYDSTEQVDIHFELITANGMWNGITFDLQVSS